MPDMMSIRDAVRRSKEDGIPISEYALRQWVRLGLIPAVSTGKKALIYYPNLVRYLQGGGHPVQEVPEGAPIPLPSAAGIRRSGL